MPAVVDDPASPTIYRVSGQPPFPDPAAGLLPSSLLLPADIVPRKVTLRDRQTVATILPVGAARHQVPASLVTYLCGQINREIEGGDTYPMMETFTPDSFADYWFQNFGAVMLLGDIESADDIPDSHDWARDCLGSFYIKPNYPGRSSHVCNGGLLVTDASRNRGVGRLMGESYIDWAPRLGYTYSVFNLVYETNVASCKIWDALGFKRIGRVKGCGNLKSHPDRLVDAIIYGRDLPPPRVPGEDGADGEDGTGINGANGLDEERFDKIRFYLKFGRYPDGADRLEKSRLRSAATHYKLQSDGETLMLKDKLVVSDPVRQYDIARTTHGLHHGGINKTTAIIAEKYHWSRIKETVSDVIRLCSQCKELGKAPTGNNGSGGATNGASGSDVTTSATKASSQGSKSAKATTPIVGTKRSRSPTPETSNKSASPRSAADSHPRQASTAADTNRSSSSGSGSGTVLPTNRVLGLRSHHTNSTLLPGTLSSASENPLVHNNTAAAAPLQGPYANPSDISVIRPSQTSLLHNHDHSPDHEHDHHNHHHTATASTSRPDDVYQPIDPQIMNHGAGAGSGDDALHAFDSYHPHSDFQALLHATGDDDDDDDGVAAAAAEAAAREEKERAAVDRDLEMLISHGEEDDVGVLGKTDKSAAEGGMGGEMDGLDESLQDGRWT